ncbi:hypothetical protein ACOME3_000577 [Neoechinorhynchus agilis]
MSESYAGDQDLSTGNIENDIYSAEINDEEQKSSTQFDDINTTTDLYEQTSSEKLDKFAYQYDGFSNSEAGNFNSMSESYAGDQDLNTGNMENDIYSAEINDEEQKSSTQFDDINITTEI